MNLILSLCFLLLPVAFAAVWNRCDRVEDLVSIRNDVLELVPEELRESASTSFPDNFEALQAEHDDIIKTLVGPDCLYHESDEGLRAEIRKLWKYFKLQAVFNVKEPFTRTVFYQMINRPFGSESFIGDIIRIDNENAYEAMVGSAYFYKVLDHAKHLPLFPEISLLLLRSCPTQEEMAALLECACRSPHLFDNFFKYLAKNVYNNVPRDELHLRIREDYPNLGLQQTLKWYNLGVKYALYVKGHNIFYAGGAASLLLSYFMIPAGSDRFLSSVGVIFGLYALGSAIRTYYRSHYYGFTDAARESFMNLVPSLRDRDGRND